MECRRPLGATHGSVNTTISVLEALRFYEMHGARNYFRAVDAPRDARLADAIGVVHSKRLPDGRWPLDDMYTGKTYFELERVGRPRRWNTLRALRVMKWWEKS